MGCRLVKTRMPQIAPRMNASHTLTASTPMMSVGRNSSQLFSRPVDSVNEMPTEATNPMLRPKRCCPLPAVHMAFHQLRKNRANTVMKDCRRTVR